MSPINKIADTNPGGTVLNAAELDTSVSTETDVVNFGVGQKLALGGGGTFENSFANAPMILVNPINNIELGVIPFENSSHL